MADDWLYFRCTCCGEVVKRPSVGVWLSDRTYYARCHKSRTVASQHTKITEFEAKMIEAKEKQRK